MVILSKWYIHRKLDLFGAAVIAGIYLTSIDRCVFHPLQVASLSCRYAIHEQSHIIAHSQGLTNGLSDRDYRVLTISLFYEQSHIIVHSQGLTNGLSDEL